MTITDLIKLNGNVNIEFKDKGGRDWCINYSKDLGGIIEVIKCGNFLYRREISTCDFERYIQTREDCIFEYLVKIISREIAE